MQHLEVSGAVRPLKWSLGVKWLMWIQRIEILFLCCTTNSIETIVPFLWVLNLVSQAK